MTLDEFVREKVGNAFGGSAAAELLAWQMKQVGIPEPMREHRFHPVRKWRFDFAWLDLKVAIEVDGGAWIGGRHTSGLGFEADCEKVSTAAAMGWRVLRVTPRMIESGLALTFVEWALGRRKESDDGATDFR